MNVFTLILFATFCTGDCAIVTTGSFFRQVLPHEDNGNGEALSAAFFSCDNVKDCRYLVKSKDTPITIQSVAKEPDKASLGTFSGVYEKGKEEAGANIALGKRSNQSTTWSSKGRSFERSFAVDGLLVNRTWDERGYFACTHTLNIGGVAWWVDFGRPAAIWRVTIYHRDDCCQDRLTDMDIRIGNKEDTGGNPLYFVNKLEAQDPDYKIVVDLQSFPVGRFLFLELNKKNSILNLCEVVVNGKLL